jgi:hypothetical protein
MKKKLFLMLALFVMSAVSMNAQVTIGSLSDPHSGAILDLSQDADHNKGFLLPHVSLDDVTNWGLPGNPPR